MSDEKLKPTMELRWVEMTRNMETPSATTYDYGICHFKLQQYWKTDEGLNGEWRDIKIQYAEYAPLIEDKIYNE